jgi:hypothetical protein
LLRDDDDDEEEVLSFDCDFSIFSPEKLEGWNLATSSAVGKECENRES